MKAFHARIFHNKHLLTQKLHISAIIVYILFYLLFKIIFQIIEMSLLRDCCGVSGVTESDEDRSSCSSEDLSVHSLKNNRKSPFLTDLGRRLLLTDIER